MREVNINRSKIIFIKGDITQQTTDAIVNAANSSLMGGGGVDGAIHRAGGPQVLAECREIIKKIGRLGTGKAVITSGGNLPAKYVIHTVGPIYSEQKAVSSKQKAELRSCYIESLELAAEKGIKTISFPSISTGAYRYPLEEAAEIAVQAVGDFLKENPSISEVDFVLFNDETLNAYLKAANL
jgi:O-acetyl-ADP-ribose deacetylase (regulator of RNase III)